MIRELPEEVIRKIAAGEVVVGAFSVVKELVENSLDAGAKRIDIEIAGGGKEYIGVSDDGVGIDEDEILLAVKPHTTSKIHDLEDLYRISTYGFRGEALSSVVRVSRVVITSRKESSPEGTRVKIEGGEILSVDKVPSPVGTAVEVRDLFFNLPARRKFLKSSSIEARMVTETVQKFILAKPEVHFTFKRDGSVVYNAVPSDLRARIALVMPDVKVRDMLELSFEKGWVRVSGFISKPGIWRKTRSGMYVFVNGRSVLSPEIVRAVESGYGEALPKGYHPIAVVFVEVPPDKVDANVHPQKIEVKFSNVQLVETTVRDAVRRSVSKAWKRDLVPKKELRYEESKVSRGVLREPTRLVEIEKSFSRIEPEESGRWKFLMILRDRYILVEDDESLLIIDYHAAHERVIYEKLKERFSKGEIESTRLIVPLRVDLERVFVDIALENREQLRRFGFEFKVDGNAVFLESVPSILPISSAEDAFKEILEELRLSKIAGFGNTIQKILADMACKSAVKTGDRIDPSSALELLQMIEREGITSCPHGRPLVFRLSFSDLDKYFGRE